MVVYTILAWNQPVFVKEYNLKTPWRWSVVVEIPLFTTGFQKHPTGGCLVVGFEKPSTV